MAYSFYMPDIGEGVVEGEIVAWKVKEGDRVKRGQLVAVVRPSDLPDQLAVPVHLHRVLRSSRVAVCGDHDRQR